MEIDLELHSGNEGRLDATMNINNDDNEGNVVDNGIIVDEDVMDLNTSENNKSVITTCIPQVGLEFDTKEAAYSFYGEYARTVGFGITIKASRRSKKSGNFIDIKIACSRFGHKRPSSMANSSRSCPKTDCKASMHIKKRPEGKWFIYSFMEEHNHEICPDDIYYALRENKNQNANDVCQHKGPHLRLNVGDVQLLLDCFMHMQAESPGFYHFMDFDKEAHMRNVFWADPKGRNDYISFSDVVFFDTHYVRSNYAVPFLPVIGVNHHFQFILLGCALIGDETKSSYVWLMRTWLRAVNGYRPKVVITDNDQSLIESAIEVFPNSSHYFCPWHVLRDIGSRLRHKLSGVEDFLVKFKKYMRKSFTNEEFERRWQKLVDKFNLMGDRWIQSLYENRAKWVPTYMRNVFLGGFCTAERSQSVASFFDKYLQKETTTKDFIDGYKLFLHERCEEEAKAENETLHSQPLSVSHSPFEKQMSKLYTHEVYEKFRTEVSGIVACAIGKDAENEIMATFSVDDLETKQRFVVSWNKGRHDICCLCHLFEYIGILCRHALSVLQLLGISTIPSNYILKRWTRNAKIRDTTPASTNFNFRLQRLNDLCKIAVKLGEEGSLSREAYLAACNAIEEALKHNVVTTAHILSFGGHKEGDSIAMASKTKRVSKKRKGQVDAETLSIGIQNSSQNAEQLNQTSHSLHDSYISQQVLQGMEMVSRVPTINSNYGAQQSNLNSLSSLHDCYYSDLPIAHSFLGNMNAVSTRVNHHTAQQSLQGLGQFGFRASSLESSFEPRDSLRNETSVHMTSKNLHG